jgi:anti-anti-sigma factor
MAAQALHDVTVVDAGVQLTMDNAHELLRLVQAMPAGFAPRVVVNMERTRAMDSTGVGALVSSMRYVRQRSGEFALTNLSPELKRMFRLMNLDTVLVVCKTVAAAEHHVTREAP